MTIEPAALRTPLDALHRRRGARMVTFAGYELPLQYASGILAEHAHTRTYACVFDVSHMGQIQITGPRAATALESLVPADVIGLPFARQRYALFTNDAGGIRDDLMIANLGEALMLTVNAARKHDDLTWLQSQIGSTAAVELLADRALIALQGPQAAPAMAALAPHAARLAFMSVARIALEGVPCIVSRSGYTGEDGFEISMPANEAERLVERILAEPDVALAGLGARDSLRLEAGLCLYGHDIDATTSPIEADLMWAIPKVRRAGGDRAGGYPGAARIEAELRAGTARRRVGLRPDGRAPIREHQALVDSTARTVGHVTSGGFGATVNGPIAMAYVDTALAAPGALLTATVRDQPRACRVVSLPFVPHRYYRGAPS